MSKGHDKGHKGQMSDREVMKLALEALEFAASQIYNEDNDDIIADAITALRQALDHVPDTMKMTEPNMGIDRGAWTDVDDATKWVDELRGDEPWDTTDMAHRTGGLSMEHEPVAWIDAGSLDELRKGVEGVYIVYETEMVGSVPLYTAPPRREWVNLTDDEISEVLGGDIHDEPSGELTFIRAIEAKLKEKNHG